MSEHLKDWLIGMIVLVVILPFVVQSLLSLFIQIDILQAWGIVSLLMVLIEGFNEIRDEANSDQEDEEW
jgi:hypothetical protein